ncbi:hypothetical protein C8R44DRAFT_724754 [Mycena epipterygia]|nr:hypothetical protein C8R44DRAFT_724754 [Mycena epipterygia]
MHFTSSLVSLTVIALASVSRPAVLPGLIARTGSSASKSASADVCACISGAIEVHGKNCGNLSNELCICVSALENLVVTTALAPITVALSCSHKTSGILAFIWSLTIETWRSALSTVFDSLHHWILRGFDRITDPDSAQIQPALNSDPLTVNGLRA